MRHNTKIQCNNQGDIPPRVQEEVCQKDSNNIRVIRTAEVRERRVRMMLRTLVLRVREVSVKQNQAQRRRRIATKITHSTHVTIMVMDLVMDMDMMTTPQMIRSRNQRRVNRRKKNHMAMKKDGMDNMDRKSQRNRNHLKIASRSLRLSLRLCRSVPRTWQRNNRRTRF